MKSNSITFFWILELLDKRIIYMHVQRRIQGTRHASRLKFEKKKKKMRKIVIFHTKYPKNTRLF